VERDGRSALYLELLPVVNLGGSSCWTTITYSVSYVVSSAGADHRGATASTTDRVSTTIGRRVLRGGGGDRAAAADVAGGLNRRTWTESLPVKCVLSNVSPVSTPLVSPFWKPVSFVARNRLDRVSRHDSRLFAFSRTKPCLLPAPFPRCGRIACLRRCASYRVRERFPTVRRGTYWPRWSTMRWRCRVAARCVAATR
jgi:hypothetical protein